MKEQLYIGLMSGTSMDAIDAALVDFSRFPPKLIITHKSPLPDELRNDLNRLSNAQSLKISNLAELDQKIALLSIKAVQQLLDKSSFLARDILAIGSHGQTVFHYPQLDYPFSIQLGDPNCIAEKTGITTISDFRRRDMAAGGQGAPLTPAFHAFLFRQEKEDRAVLNLGGIANITYLPANPKTLIQGFDIGPANLLLDKWTQKHLGQWFDRDGTWASSTIYDKDLLQQLSSDPYFQHDPPKSTGQEYFNLSWLDTQLEKFNQPFNPATVQATLCELTATTIASALQQIGHYGVILLCGGGSKNIHLVKRLKYHCSPCSLYHCDDFGFPSEWIEAMAFAWLAKQTLEGKTSNLPEVTGARNPTLLGGIYLKNQDSL